MRLFRAISKIGKRPKFEVPTFLRNINLVELIDWINELEYFEYEDIEDPDRVCEGKTKGTCEDLVARDSVGAKWKGKGQNHQMGTDDS